jgi:hypothetical protein
MKIQKEMDHKSRRRISTGFVQWPSFEAVGGAGLTTVAEAGVNYLSSWIKDFV